MTTIKLDPGAALLLDALHGAGHAAYAVGGCVRDSLLGLDPHDWDLCTSARPEQVMALFGEEKCIPTGLQHGTVTVKQGGRLYETTTFRTEGPTPMAATRMPSALCRMCGRILPGGISPLTLWHIAPRRGSSTLWRAGRPCRPSCAGGGGAGTPL